MIECRFRLIVGVIQYRTGHRARLPAPCFPVTHRRQRIGIDDLLCAFSASCRAHRHRTLFAITTSIFVLASAACRASIHLLPARYPTWRCLTPVARSGIPLSFNFSPHTSYGLQHPRPRLASSAEHTEFLPSLFVSQPLIRLPVLGNQVALNHTGFFLESVPDIIPCHSCPALYGRLLLKNNHRQHFALARFNHRTGGCRVDRANRQSFLTSSPIKRQFDHSAIDRFMSHSSVAEHPARDLPSFHSLRTTDIKLSVIL